MKLSTLALKALDYLDSEASSLDEIATHAKTPYLCNAVRRVPDATEHEKSALCSIIQRYIKGFHTYRSWLQHKRPQLYQKLTSEQIQALRRELMLQIIAELEHDR